jgi:hypothetical protein
MRRTGAEAAVGRSTNRMIPAKEPPVPQATYIEELRRDETCRSRGSNRAQLAISGESLHLRRIRKLRRSHSNHATTIIHPTWRWQLDSAEIFKNLTRLAVMRRILSDHREPAPLHARLAFRERSLCGEIRKC